MQKDIPFSPITFTTTCNKVVVCSGTFFAKWVNMIYNQFCSILYSPSTIVAFKKISFKNKYAKLESGSSSFINTFLHRCAFSTWPTMVSCQASNFFCFIERSKRFLINCFLRESRLCHFLTSNIVPKNDSGIFKFIYQKSRIVGLFGHSRNYSKFIFECQA